MARFPPVQLPLPDAGVESVAGPLRRGQWRADGRHAWLASALLGLLVIWLVVPDGFDYAGLTTTGAPASGGLLSRAIWMLIVATSGALVLWRRHLAGALLVHLNLFLPCFLVLAALSLDWSIDPVLGGRRLMRLATIVLACVAFVLVAWRPHRFQQALRPAVTLLLVGSLLFGLLVPSLAIHAESAPELLGAWRGLASHKNGLGALASFGVMLWVHALWSHEVRRLPALLGVLLAATCLVLSRSSTSMAATAVVIGVLWLGLRSPARLRHHLPLIMVLLAALAAVYALALLDVIPGLAALMAPLTALTGKSGTLTGRTEIWAIVGEHARLHPWFGTGYGAYWTTGPVYGEDSFVFLARMGGFYPGSAHNGYLEIANDLGLAGIGVLAAYLAVQLFQCLQLRATEPTQATLYLALLFQQAVTNLSESHWFTATSVDTVLLTLASAALARAALQRSWARRYGDPADATGPTGTRR